MIRGTLGRRAVSCCVLPACATPLGLSMRRAPAAYVALPAASHSSMLVARRGVKTDKMLIGALGAFMSSTATIGLFHLLVIKVPLTMLAGTIGAATVSGLFAALEGDAGASFGTVVGLFFGGIGCYFAKSANEPWKN
jgi:hypothetical protein